MSAQVTTHSRAFCKPITLVAPAFKFQNGLFCMRQLRNAERFGGAPIGGSCAPGRRPVLVAERNSVRESGRRIADAGMGAMPAAVPARHAQNTRSCAERVR